MYSGCVPQQKKKKQVIAGPNTHSEARTQTHKHVDPNREMCAPAANKRRRSRLALVVLCVSDMKVGAVRGGGGSLSLSLSLVCKPIRAMRWARPHVLHMGHRITTPTMPVKYSHPNTRADPGEPPPLYSPEESTFFWISNFKSMLLSVYEYSKSSNPLGGN